AEDGIGDWSVTGVQTCALPICTSWARRWRLGERQQFFSPRRVLRGEGRLSPAARLTTVRRGGRPIRPRRWPARRAATGTAAKTRSEERRVGKEWRARREPEQGR